ncbi:MAG: hypothetical protein ABR552_04995, partial [Actinomycetota bacterium]
LENEYHAAYNDRPIIWADQSPGSRCFGDVYVVDGRYDDQYEHMSLFRSTDGGSSWSQPIDVVPPFGWEGGFFTAEPRSLPDGTLVIGWDFVDDTQYPIASGAIRATTSRDCGASFDPAVTVVDMGPSTLQRSVFPGASFRTHSNPDLAVDKRGTAYIVWPQYDSTTHRSLIWLSRSTNGTRSWSPPLAISRPADGNAFNTSIGVSPSGRDILISWANVITSSSEPGSGLATLGMLYAISHDGGATFSLDQLSSATGDPDGSTGLTGSDLFNPLRRQFVGDFNQTTVSDVNGAVRATVVWTDVRNAVACPAVDAYRDAWRAGEHPAPPDPRTACPAGFANTDIYSRTITLRG